MSSFSEGSIFRNQDDTFSTPEGLVEGCSQLKMGLLDCPLQRFEEHKVMKNVPETHTRTEQYLLEEKKKNHQIQQISQRIGIGW